MLDHRFLRSLFLLIFLSAILLACSKKEVKPSDEDLIRIKGIYAIVNKLKEEYREKDLVAFLGIVDPQMSDSADALKNGLETDFNESGSIDLEFRIDGIILDKDLATVNLHWEGEWEKKSDKVRLKEKGNAIFKIRGEKELRLSSIEGDNPFGIFLSRELISKEKGG